MSGKRKLSFLRAATAGGPLTLPPNKHPYLFSLGHIVTEATGPCQEEISTYWWRLSPGQRSGVKTGGGSGAAEQQSSKETGSLVGSVWALLRRQASSLIEYLSRLLTRLGFHQVGLFSVDLSECRRGTVWSVLGRGFLFADAVLHTMTAQHLLPFLQTQSWNLHHNGAAILWICDGKWSHGIIFQVRMTSYPIASKDLLSIMESFVFSLAWVLFKIMEHRKGFFFFSCKRPQEGKQDALASFLRGCHVVCFHILSIVTTTKLTQCFVWTRCIPLSCI